MEQKVIVLTPNGRRQNVKVNPNTTLLQILEEASKKHGFDSDTYCLKHHNKEVDLTQMFRFSGLPNNALLEMEETTKKRIVSTVDICVQLEDGTRVQGQFSPTKSLWDVVEHLSAAAATQYTSPVAIYMRQEIIGKEELCNTTLKSLGITEGRAMIRFISKDPNELKVQANVYIPPTIKETQANDEVVKNAQKNARTTAPGAGGFAVTRDLVQSLKKTASGDDIKTKQNGEDQQNNDNSVVEEKPKPKYDWGTGTGHSILDSETEIAERENRADSSEEEKKFSGMETEPEVYILGSRNAILFSLESSQKQMDNLPDSFFDLTVHDLKLVLRDLKKVATGNEEAPLLTERLRELEENKTMLNKIAQYKNCVIRVQFPDRYVLQGMFKPIDTGADVVDFVRSYLQNADTKFYLFTIPPKTVLSLDKTLLEQDLVPTALIHFALGEAGSKYAIDVTEPEQSSADQTVVRADFLSKLTSAEGALFAAHKFRTADIFNRKEPTINAEAGTVPTAGTSKSHASGAIPKRARNEDTAQQTS